MPKQNPEPENPEPEKQELEKPKLRVAAPNTQETQSTQLIEEPEPIENSEPAPQPLTRAEIVQILDDANQGIAPTPEAIAALLNTPHEMAILDAIRRNPDWGIDLSIYATPDQKTALNRQMREYRKSRLKAIALLPEPPSIEFLQECCEDQVLARDVKNLIAKKPNWNFVSDSNSTVDYRF